MILTTTLATKKQRNVSRIRRSFLGVLVGAMTMMPAAVNAQGVGPDQDSLLPPEVVPLDPSAISRTSAAPNNQASNFGSAPGLSNGSSQPPEPTQSAQDFRKAYFDSLNQAPIRQLTNNPNLQMMQGQMGQFPPSQQPNQPNSLNPSQFGSNAPGSAPGLVASDPGQTMQTQTLSGGVKDQTANNKPSKLAKAQHTLGLATSFGAAGMSGMSSGAGMYSLGLMGVSLMNMGLRSSLSHF
jgi:hypothetical protein